MAIIRPGPTTGAISGNAGGINFVLGKNGPYIRKTRRPSQSRSKLQLLNQRKPSVASKAWQDLLPDVRDAWNTITKPLTWTNRLGIKRNLSTWQAFAKYVYHAYPEVTQFGSPPFTLHISPPLAILSPSLSVTNDWTLTIDAVSAPFTQYARTWISRPVSAKSRAHYTNWYEIDTTFFGTLSGPRTIYTIATQDPRLAAIQEGERIGIRSTRHLLKPKNLYYWSQPAFTEAIVTA